MVRVEYGTEPYTDPRDMLRNFPESFDDLTKEHLQKFFVENSFPDAILAKHYGVTKYRVKKKREDFGLSRATMIYEQAKAGSVEFNNANEQLREFFCGEGNVEWLSKGITHYAFRNGPVENMHGHGKLSQADMKTLNKFMVDRIAEILLCYNADDFVRLTHMIGTPTVHCGRDWDAPEPDFSAIDRKICKT